MEGVVTRVRERSSRKGESGRRVTNAPKGRVSQHAGDVIRQLLNDIFFQKPNGLDCVLKIKNLNNSITKS